jgi:hypothetical protein
MIERFSGLSLMLRVLGLVASYCWQSVRIAERCWNEGYVPETIFLFLK